MTANTVEGVLRRVCREQGARPALLCPGQPPLSFTDLGNIVTHTGDVLRHFGLTHHSRVVVLLPQGPENLLLCLSVMTVACCVPLNPASTAREIAQVLASLRPDLLICADHAQALIDLADQAGIACATLTNQHQAQAGRFLLTLPKHPPQRVAPGGDVSMNALPGDPISLLLHTSGSTAAPKAVPISTAMLLASAGNLCRSLALTERDLCLNMMPQFHIGALLDLFIAPLLQGGATVVCRTISANTFFSCLTEFAPSWFQGVPTMLADILDHARQQDLSALPRLRFCRSVSASLSPATHAQFETVFGCPVIEIYGMTETCGVICSNPLPPGQRRTGSVGPCVAGEVAILDEVGNTARAGLRGEVVVRGRNLFGGYLGQDNQHHFIGDWFRTGDQGYLDDQGYLFLSGRLKELINRGGEKIAPMEIDQALLAFPGIRDAASFALPHPSLGEEPAAALVCEGASLDMDALQFHLKTELAAHKIPRRVYVVESLPRTPSGKLQRHLLSQQFSGAQPAAANKRFPETALAKLIAQQWQTLLGVAAIGIDDDFFDLGGDSLKATTFIEQLEDALNTRLDAGVLFDEPTIAALEAWITRQVYHHRAPGQYQSAYLLPDVYAELRRTTDTWQGTRPSQNALMVAYNTLGDRPTLFWSCQDRAELAALVAALGPQQPVIGLRTLYKMRSKSARNSADLARHYAAEVRELIGDKPYFIGGFCEGGRIAFQIASELSADHKPPLSLIMIDHWTKQPYPGRVALAFSRDSRYSPYRYFCAPERGWRKYYRGTLSAEILEAGHLSLFQEDRIDAVATAIANELARARQQQAPANAIGQLAAQPMDESAYHAEIVAATPQFARPHATLQLEISVCNRSDRHWPQGNLGGPVVNSRWRSPYSGKVRIWRGTPVALPRPMAPGEQLTLSYPVTTPGRFGPWQLELDLVDEGVSWFGEHGSTPARRRIFLSPGAPLLNALLKPLWRLHQLINRTRHAA